MYKQTTLKKAAKFPKVAFKISCAYRHYDLMFEPKILLLKTGLFLQTKVAITAEIQIPSSHHLLVLMFRFVYLVVLNVFEKRHFY